MISPLVRNMPTTAINLARDPGNLRLLSVPCGEGRHKILRVLRAFAVNTSSLLSKLIDVFAQLRDRVAQIVYISGRAEEDLVR